MNVVDRAVFATYAWPEGIGGEEILKSLLALNPERSACIGAPDAPVVPDHEEPPRTSARMGPGSRSAWPAGERGCAVFTPRRREPSGSTSGAFYSPWAWTPAFREYLLASRWMGPTRPWLRAQALRDASGSA